MRLVKLAVLLASLAVVCVSIDLSTSSYGEATYWASQNTYYPGTLPKVEPVRPSPSITSVKRVEPPTAGTSVATSPKVNSTQKSGQPRLVNLYPVTALGSQATIDQGKLVTWMTSPTCLLAGHDNMGWAWLNSIPTGTVVEVHTGPCSGTYRIVGHNWQTVKGGPVPSWMRNYALILQTCTGAVGMGFSEAEKIG